MHEVQGCWEVTGGAGNERQQLRGGQPQAGRRVCEHQRTGRKALQQPRVRAQCRRQRAKRRAQGTRHCLCRLRVICAGANFKRRGS